MHTLAYVKQHILMLIEEQFKLPQDVAQSLNITFNYDPEFGDMSLNAAFVVAKFQKRQPNDVAQDIQTMLTSPILNDYENKISIHINKVEIAGGAFLNIFLNKDVWQTIASELAVHPTNCFKLFDDEPRSSYLIEFVSANPTGPLSLAHGRNAIIGDVLAKVLTFLGHSVTKEYYINDSGQQIKNLGTSLQNKVYKELNLPAVSEESEYDNEYMTELSQKCVEEFGNKLSDKDTIFFQQYAKNYFLAQIKKDLESYGVCLDSWVSEEELRNSGKVDNVVKELEDKGHLFCEEGAMWFRTTAFGDDKDRVLVKQDKTLTYLAPDIAYHKEKLAHKTDFIINILGQDHHGYEKRLRAAIIALGFNPEKFYCLFYQLVMMKQNDEIIRMSKRKGNFKSLAEVVEEVGADVARFFYLNKKMDSHLNFDLALALTKSDANPVYYIQYAYVRTKSILKRAASLPSLADFATQMLNNNLSGEALLYISYQYNQPEIDLLRKTCSLRQTLLAIANTFQTHLLANYTQELAQMFHSYYNSCKVIDEQNESATRGRLQLVFVVKNTLSLCLDLLGLCKPDKM